MVASPGGPEPGEGDVWLCGGSAPAGQLLTEFDELILNRCPVLAGVGLPAFGGRSGRGRSLRSRR